MLQSVVRCIFVIGVVAAGSSVAHAQVYMASLQGAQEVPGTGSTAQGFARITLNDNGTLDYYVVYDGLSSAQTSAHIHSGIIGASGPIVVTFEVIGGTSGVLSGTADLTPTNAAAVRSNGAYVNVHSVDNPGGEIRGQLAITRVADFDGDGRSDVGIVRPTNVAPPTPAPLMYYNINSTTGFQAVAWGDSNTDVTLSGDYDGDGRTDMAIYREGAIFGAPSTFYILRSSDSGVTVTQFGIGGDYPVPGDYDGDGLTDIAVFRRGANFGGPGMWYIRRSSDSGVDAIHWGTTGDNVSSGDYPVPRDYDGDGKTDLAVYRFGMGPANSFLIRQSTNLQYVVRNWGNFDTDYLMPADYDGDGKADFAVVRSTNYQWWILNSSGGNLTVAQFGSGDDIPLPRDFDGDGRADIAVYRPGATDVTQSYFWIRNSLTSSLTVRPWGLGMDSPVGHDPIN